MACRKCGSPWATIHGADRASCPECCKLARHHERISGRYKDPEEQRQCAACGADFIAVGIAEIRHRKCCSSSCQTSRRKSWLKAWRQSRKGLPINGNAKPRVAPRPLCRMCGEEIRSKNGRKYCSPKCFHEARNAGIQAWDRSRIEEAARTRPNNVNQSPLRYAARDGRKEMQWFLRKISSLWRHAADRHAIPRGIIRASAMARFVRNIPVAMTCKTCGVQCVKPASWRLPHCSIACAQKDFTPAVCASCGRGMKVRFLGGNVEARIANPVCNKCVLNRHKRRCGDFRKRCRRFGVPHDPKVTRQAVFGRDGYRCHICKRRTLRKYIVANGRAHPRSPTVDHHPYPLSVGVKGHEWDNVRCACLRCNVRKGASWTGQPLLFT